MIDFRKGAYDLHVHTAPDVIARKCSDEELAKRSLSAGMKGFAIKAHFSDTAARASLLRERYPELTAVGGITLNRAVGGLNPEAVKCCALTGGRMVWFPTMDARNWQQFRYPGKTEAELSGSLTVLDEQGRLRPEALQILKIAAEFRMIVGTGHLSPREGLALVRAAAECGAQIVLTHADNPADRYTADEQREAVRLGAVVEHSFYTVFYGETSRTDLTEQIRAAGCENVFLSSDFGQVTSPYADEGLEQFCRMLLESGFTENELVHMTQEVPERLLAG